MTPIIYFHRGNPEYLKTSIENTLFFNPNNPIILLGDESNKNIHPKVQHYFISNYQRSFKPFENEYEHLNTLSRASMLACFERFFVMLDLVIEKKIDSFVYIDSDALLFVDVNLELEKIKPFDCAYNFFGANHNIAASAHFSFWPKIGTLNRLCDFMLLTYRNKTAGIYLELKRHFEEVKEKNLEGGADDMALLHFFGKQPEIKLYNLQEIKDGSIYDDAISEVNFLNSVTFKKHKYIREIKWENGLPYSIEIKSNKKIIFNGLHFQGNNKNLMPYFVSNKTFLKMIRYNKITLFLELYKVMVQCKLKSVFTK